MTDPRIAGLLRTRARAIQHGDINVANTCTVELAQHGYEDANPVPAPELETTQAAPLPENTARPRAPRKRTKK